MRRRIRQSLCLAALLPIWWHGAAIGADAQPDYLSFSTDDEANTTEVFQRASPAVVFVTSSELRRQRFTRNVTEIPRGAGSGFIWDAAAGLVVTNYHVVAGADRLTITLADEDAFQAEVVGLAPERDLAVLRMIDPPAGLVELPVGDSSELSVGRKVMAIGNPFGFSHTVTTGVISAINRSIRAEDRVYHDFIQIDASINPGNSGGPLLNINGNLIGINTAIYAKAQGIGFAIPISKARKIISDLIQYGEVIQAWIGITVQGIDEKLARYLKVSAKRGVMVTSVEPQSPAQKAGLQEGDIILAIDDKKINTIGDYQSVAKGLEAGHMLKAKLWRSGKKKTVSVKTKVSWMIMST